MKPTIALVAAADFAPSYTWDINISNFTGGNPVEIPTLLKNVWIPATRVSEEPGVISMYEVQAGSSFIVFPKNVKYGSVSVDFNDTAGYQTYRFFMNWFYDSYTSTNTGVRIVKPLKQCCKILTVKKLDSTNVTQTSNAYSVFISSAPKYSGSSESSAFSFSVTFQVVSNEFTDQDTLGRVSAIAKSPATLG